MVTFASIQTLLAVLGLSLAIPLSSNYEICYQPSSFPPKNRVETLLIVPAAHDLAISSRASASEESYHSETVSPPLITSLAAFPGHDLTTAIVTVAIPASTATEYITLPSPTTTGIFQVVSSAQPFSLEPSPRPIHDPEPGPFQETWSTPSRMIDLSSFGITHFPSGQQNVELVSSLPFDSSRNPSNDEHSLIRVLYPAHSINPAQSPVGGASFYASPIKLSSAMNVSLQYSIFFPASFDWVKGGKLPGLYGGRTGCSGGTDAKDCFSTRLMWRAEGVGELYLYAPKSRQPPSLCSSPGSTCNRDYGFSIGRGSFAWTTNTWTTVTQTIVLNTDGKANGWFTLYINGKLVIERRDIYYRDRDRQTPVKPTNTMLDPSVTRSHTQATSTKTANGGLLGDLLNPLLGHGTVSKQPSDVVVRPGALINWIDQPQRLFSVNVDAGKGSSGGSQGLVDVNVQVPLVSASANIGEDGSQVSVNIGQGDSRSDDEDRDRQTEQVGLVGIFFSTFFGGHDDRYATPKDQYVWFKDFSLTVNA